MHIFKKWMAGIACVSLMLSCVACGTPAQEDSAPASGAFTAGTFTGVSPNGKNGSISVEVTFTEAAIESVKIVEHKETPGLSDSAIQRVPEEIVAGQSLNIAAVAGATITGDAIVEAVADAVKQANGDVDALRAKELAQSGTGEVVNMETQLVIVGGGATGIAAAISAAQNGAESVLVLEKTASIGGNAMVSGGFLEYISAPSDLRPENTPGYDQMVDGYINAEPQSEEHAKLQATLKQEYEAYKASGSTKVFDSPTLLALDYYTLEPYSTPEAMLDFATLLDDTTQWFTDLGMEWKPLIGIVGYSWPRWTSPLVGFEGHGYFDLFERMIAENNYPIEIMTETPATELISENGKVTGVVAKDRNGKEYRILSEKGVVLATGGFAANPEMLMEYNTMWEGLTLDMPTTNISGTTGDGIIMAQAVGAKTEMMDDIMLFPNADPISNSTENIVGDTGDPLYINKEGKRFVDESLDRYALSGALLEQTDQIQYIISDKTNSMVTDGHTFNGFDVEEMIANKQLYRADTLEELAAQLGIEGQVLVDTVNTYNTYAANFKDEEFGRISFSTKSAVDEAPFYACPRIAAAHITGGGLVRDEQYRVLNEKDEPIEGLYAGGEVTAYMSGISSFGDGMYIGRILFEK